jgi:hypothetical protein
MNKTSFVNENLEHDTHIAIREYFDGLTCHGIICGEKINRGNKHYSNDFATAVINLIKDGSVSHIEDPLIYCMVKANINADKGNDEKRVAYKNLLQKITDFNGGNIIISSGKKTFSIIANGKVLKLNRRVKNEIFVDADFTFDFYRNQKPWLYPHVSLMEDDTPIRIYKENIGEERSVRYEVLNGLGRVVTTPDKITYTEMDVQGSYIYHQDSGHGWLEVPVGEIRAMGLEKRITPYSYLYRDKAYLEEDLDAGTFLDIRKLLPKPVAIQNNHMDGMCYIRDFPHYKAENIMVGKEKPARKTSRSKDIEWER